MKIDKVIFSCSEPPAYSSYWNIQSKIYKKGLGIEPVCLLFGKKANTNMSEEFGTVIEMETSPNFPWSVQMTFSKFNHTRSEPETTWLIGDIDLVPLQKNHFTGKISHYNPEAYLCLNGSGISIPRCGRYDAFEHFGSERHGKDGGFIGSDIPAHYHASKGKNFESLYFQGRPLDEILNYVISSDRYGLAPMSNRSAEQKAKEKIENPYWYYWCAEENYTSELLWNARRAGKIEYKGVAYDNEHARIYKWNKDRKDYEYSVEKLRDHEYVDAHCCQARPYEVQAEAFERILDISGVLQ